LDIEFEIEDDIPIENDIVKGVQAEEEIATLSDANLATPSRAVRGRAEPISKYNVLYIKGKNSSGRSVTEYMPNNQHGIDNFSYTATHTYMREGLEIAFERRGSVGNVYGGGLIDYSSVQIGAPFNCTYDEYGGLVEWSFVERITITNPDISELKFEVTVSSSGTGSIGLVTREIIIPLTDSRAEGPQSPEITYDPVYPDSYVLTGTDTTMEYAVKTTANQSSYTWVSCSGEDMVIEATRYTPVYLIRYKATENLPESQFRQITVPARAKAPSVSYSEANELIKGLTTDMEYCIDGGEYIPVTEEMTLGNVSSIIDEMTDTDSVEYTFRLRADNQPASFGKSITLYKRLEPPTGVTFYPRSLTLTGVKSGMEYCVEGEDKWLSITTSANINLSKYASAEKDITVQVRYRRTSTNAYSHPVYFTIPMLGSAPQNLTINYQSESITGFDPEKQYEYATTSPTNPYSKMVLTDGEFVLGSNISKSSTRFYIREAAADGKSYSAYTFLEVPGRKEAPAAVMVYNDPDVPETQAILTNIDTTMEYRKYGESVWNPVTDETMIFDIPETDVTYYIREKVTDTAFLSFAKTVSLQTYYLTPSIKLNLTSEAITDLRSTHEYRVNGGQFIPAGSTTSISVSDIASALAPDETYEVDIRYMRTAARPVGEIKTVTIYPRPAAPQGMTYNPTTYIL